jgi:TRAP transporter 4TM/12TM fusion protein
MEVGATWVVIFIFYAGLVEGYGGMKYITNIGRRLGQRMEGGVVQVAVITSFIVGSVMGGSVSNVATTGSFTIPMMKDHGVEPKIAGAIESIASTGGQILPPVMGSAAFIMADILGISYYDVIIGAVLPALLFYMPVAFIVFLSNRKHKWGFDNDAVDLDQENAKSKADNEREVDADLNGQKTVESPGFFHMFVRGLPYILSFLVLLYYLVIKQSDPLYSGAYATVSMMIFAIPRYLVIEGLSIDAAQAWLEGTVKGCTAGAKNMAPLTAVLSMLGVVVTVLTQSGFTQDFSFLVLNSYQGIGLLLLILVMAMSILFGMGMPSAPAYIVVAIVSAPVLVSTGIEPLVAHLYVFYFALLSTITPPVALSCAMASGIAGASFYDTAKETLRLGIYSFIVPFVFVYSPSIVLWDSGTPIAFAVGIFGICLLGFALVGHNGKRDLTFPERGLFTLLSLSVLFVPRVVSNALLWPLIGVTVAFIGLTMYLSSLKGSILARVDEI